MFLNSKNKFIGSTKILLNQNFPIIGMKKADSSIKEKSQN